MEIVTVMNIEMPVMGDKVGSFATAEEVFSGKLLARFDVFIQSWDGVYQLVNIDAQFRAEVKSVGGFRHSVYCHAGRKLAVFFRGC